MAAKKSKNKSLSEKVEETFAHCASGSEYDSEKESAPRVIDFDEEDYNFDKNENSKSLSRIRKENIPLLSEQNPKYSGEIAHRQNSDNFDDKSSIDDQSSQENLNDSEYELNDINYSSEEEEEGDKIKNVGKAKFAGNLIPVRNNQLDVEKGICVQNQLLIWEKLLELRINSQKILNKANSLPCPSDFSLLSANKDVSKLANETQKNVAVLLEKLIETQANLANQKSEIKKLQICSRKRSNPDAFEVGSSIAKRFAPALKLNFEKFQPYRDSVLLKWDDRMRVITSGAAKKHMSQDFDVIKKINNVLIKRGDHILKSQKLKGNYTLFGQSTSCSNESTDAEKCITSPEIYDDTDFYHSQLRELIEFKSNVSSSAYDVTKQFSELQKLRQKMKKTVDTRASKGRKMRYVLHHKLINFMAPHNNTEWSNESKNELYRSLFVT